MNKKKLTKKIWYGSDIDNTGQPIIPPLAKNPDDLDGLHEGELFLHNSDEQPNIWIRTSGGRIVPLFKGGGGTADSISWINITDKPAWLVDGIIDYSEIVGAPDLSLYAKKSYVDTTFVSLSGDEDVSGIKNFTNGIKLSGIEFKYDSENNAVCLQKSDGTPINFYVTGGLSMYGQGNTSVKSIMDAIAANLDSNTLAIQNGLLTVIGGTGGGIDESAVRSLIESYDYATKDFVRDYVLQNATGGEFELSKQMVIDALGFTPYSAENPNGYITAASIPSALKNPYALTFGSKNYDGSAAKTITASDLGISNWALAASKPSYSYSEITGAPTNLSQLTDDVVSGKYLPLSGGTLTGQTDAPLYLRSNTASSYLGFKDLNGNTLGYIGVNGEKKLIFHSDSSRIIYHSGNFNPSDYLPLSGGTVNGIITLNHNLGKSSGIAFKNNRTAESSGWAVTVLSIRDASSNIMANLGAFGGSNALSYLYLGHNNYDGNNLRIYTDKVTFGSNKIWHAGNGGSGSGMDADTLDGYQETDFFRYRGGLSNINQNDITYNGTYTVPDGDVSSLGYPANNAHLLHFDKNGFVQLLVNFAGEAYIRQRWYGNTPSNWKKLAFIDSNVASATKLQTARTIWGQSFDGTADVTGTALIGNNVAGGELLRFNMDRPWTFIQEESGAASKLVLKPLTDSKYFIVKNANNEKLLLCYAVNGGNIIEIGGTLRLDNNKNLQAKDSSGASISLFGFNSSNQLSIGYGLNSKGYIMGLGGKIVNFYYGTERTLGMVLNENGNLVPSASNTYALGAYNNNWSYIYTTGIRRWDGSTANEAPLLHGESNNTNITLLRVSYASSSYFAQTGAYGFTLKYFGIGGGNANYLKLLADNQTAASQVLALCVDQAGNIGVGCDTNEDYKLRVNGTGYFSSNLLVGGGITMQSARILKNVVDERGLSLTELSAIKPTRYTWKDKRDDRIHFGGIADDIEKVLPEVIYTTSDGTLTMDYGNAAFAVATSLIQPVVDHEERIKVLERENKELKERLNRYSA